MEAITGVDDGAIQPKEGDEGRSDVMEGWWLGRVGWGLVGNVVDMSATCQQQAQISKILKKVTCVIGSNHFFTP